MTQHFATRRSKPGLAPEIYVSFFFVTHLSSSDNIFETETWYFGGNKGPKGHKGPHSDPADKTSLGSCIVSNVSKWSNILLKMK